MTEGWTNQLSSGSGQAFRFVVRRPSWITRIALTIVALVVLAILALIAIPVVAIGVVALIGIGIASRVRSLLAGTRRPNGVLDGRRNVRVIVRD